MINSGLSANGAVGNPENVTVGDSSSGDYTFTGIPGKITNLHWVDNDKILQFNQSGDTLTMNCTGYPYGVNLVVRVAEADIE